MGSRIVDLNPGEWQTVESFWNVNANLFFQKPAGARIRVQYGLGIISWITQVQTLNGFDVIDIEINNASLCGARVQIWVNSTTQLNYQFRIRNNAGSEQGRDGAGLGS
jgi:hypothetical protein